VAGASDAAERSLAAIAGSDRPEVWISRFDDAHIRDMAARVDEKLQSGADLPLAGLTFAVKDNIDVAGLDTTAGCPDYAYSPGEDAPAVRALLQAGAVCIGKTNLDQFATGLVGTRSPYGAVRNALVPDRISGGSSSGSAVAVALGMVDLALGTDTAGSGRVPAALNGIVGCKATYGLVSTQGVVPACFSFDCVTVFAATVALAGRAMAEMAGPGGSAPDRRPFPTDAPLGGHRPPIIARPLGLLTELSPSRLAAYTAALEHLERMGCELVDIDLAPFLDAGRLLYQGAFVAERYEAVGEWMLSHPDQLDPTVQGIILGAEPIAAHRLAADIRRLAGLRALVSQEWQRVGADSLVLPTVPMHPTLAEVAADPVGTNTALGRFTTFLNLLDLCAVAVPFGTCDGLPHGVSCIGPAFSDLVQLQVARQCEEPRAMAGSGDWRQAGEGQLHPSGVALAVVGAHLSGQPLNHQLTDRGGRLLGPAVTAATYRLFALRTEPPKPGLIRVGEGGVSIALEVWELPPSGFADFVAHLPAPMAIGTLALSDGSEVTGFLCEPMATEDALDISRFGGWRNYLASA
jgi:allophanate hydrolase